MNDSKISIQRDNDILEKVDFVKDSWKFVPKHLIAIRNQQKKTVMKGLKKKLKEKEPTYQQTTLQIINKNKNLYLTPVRDIQKIMKHFKNKFQDPIKTTSSNFQILNHKTKNAKKNPFAKRIRTSVDIRVQNQEDELDSKINRILQLPTIKRAKSQAQKLKLMNMEQANKKSFQKQQILRKFNIYFSKQINLINTKNTQSIIVEKQDINLRKLRAKTSVD